MSEQRRGQPHLMLAAFGPFDRPAQGRGHPVVVPLPGKAADGPLLDPVQAGLVIQTRDQSRHRVRSLKKTGPFDRGTSDVAFYDVG